MEPKTPRDVLLASCNNHSLYPRNLVGQRTSPQRIDAYLEKLVKEERRLFNEKARVNVLDDNGDDSLGGLKRSVATSVGDVKGLVQIANGVTIPRCRFIFIQAAHSRAPLRISRDMLTFICSWYQIPPSFLDFIFPFGEKERGRRDDSCVLRDDSCLYPQRRSLEISSLRRSGYEIRLSYHLQSVEPSPRQVSLGWSIRQTAVYHSYDVLTKNALFINVKGNQLLENTIDAQAMVENRATSGNRSPLFATLATHVVFAEWAAQNWREYINELEDLVWQATDRTIFIPLTNPPEKFDNTSTTVTRQERNRMSTNPKENTGQRPAGVGQRMRPPEMPSPDIPLRMKTNLTESSFGSEESRFLDDFSFSDLQDVQAAEEKIEEVILVLTMNMSTLRDLRGLYRSHVERVELPEDFNVDDVTLFEADIIAVEKELDRQVERSRTLLAKNHERKTLLSNILQYRSMKASEFFAAKAQQSSDSMERITKDMHILAKATQKETVSMRIITLVTLFFLPGTFVATFMSTDVLRWNDNHRQYVPEALSTYFAITLPLTVLTFMGWVLLAKFDERGNTLLRFRKRRYLNKV